MSENKEKEADKIARQKLWLESEKRLTTGFNPEDLRTSGLLAIERKSWASALLRLTEAVRWGISDLQTLDSLGEAAYRTKTPQALMPFQQSYTDPLVAVHMARAFLMMGQIPQCRQYLDISQDTLLKEAILTVTKFEKNIETAIVAVTTPLKNPSENLNLIEYWQLLAPVAEVAGREDLVLRAERKLKAYAYDRPVVHFNQALRFLAKGELSAGWKLYDWRLGPGSPCAARLSCADLSIWEGENLFGKKLVVILENGFGDQIFSLRFCQALIDDGFNLTIAVRSELFSLVKTSFPQLDIHRSEDVYLPEYWRNKPKPDYWVYAFSIPARSQHTGYVATDGYLKADVVLTKKISDQIKVKNPQSLPIKSITWHGDIQTAPMRTRAYSVTEILQQSEILKTPCVVVSLQKDATSAEIKVLEQETKNHGCIFINPAAELTDFSVTAAWMQNCDHIFSCDTAVAHLAGALARPSTVLIRNKSIWHWISSENTIERKNISKWYSSVEVKFALTPKYSYMFDITNELNSI